MTWLSANVYWLESLWDLSPQPVFYRPDALRVAQLITSDNWTWRPRSITRVKRRIHVEFLVKFLVPVLTRFRSNQPNWMFVCRNSHHTKRSRSMDSHRALIGRRRWRRRMTSPGFPSRDRVRLLLCERQVVGYKLSTTGRCSFVCLFMWSLSLWLLSQSHVVSGWCMCV